MNYQTLYDLMELYEDNEIELKEQKITTGARIAALTMARLGPRAVSGPQRHGNRPMRRTLRTVLIAAAVTLALSVTAWAVYQARIADYMLPEPTAEAEPTTGEEPAAAAEMDRPVADISLVGYQGTPEYEAYVEWTNYLDEAGMVDYAAMDVDDSWHETPEYYAWFYNAYTRQQADKLDEIMDKYGLTPHAARVLFNVGEAQGLYDALGMEPVLPDEYTDALGGYLYDDGTFKLENAGGEDELSLTLFVSVKGSFSLALSSIGADYEEWGYTTAGGQTVDLILCADSGTVLYETPGAYIHASGTYDMFTDAPHMSREELEAFADTINFTALEKRFDGAEHGDTARKVAELNERQDAARAEETAVFYAPFSSAEERNQYIYTQLGDWRYPTAPEGYTYMWRNTDYAKGNYYQSWDIDNGLYFDMVNAGYSYDTGDENAYESLVLGYSRYYTDETRAEISNLAQFDEMREHSKGTDCQVGSCRAVFAQGNGYDELGEGLYWLDEERGLIFSLRSDCYGSEGDLPNRSQEELIALAEELMDSFA